MYRQTNNLRVGFVRARGDDWRVLLIRDLNMQDAITGEPVHEISNCGDCGGLRQVSEKEWKFEHDAEADNTECDVFANLVRTSWEDVESAKFDLQKWYNEKREEKHRL